MEDIRNQLSEAKYFLKRDLRTGYHQVRFCHALIPSTAFRTRYGHFEIFALCFGLRAASATFKTLTNDVSADYLEKF